jgi:hypothetical protein
LRSVGSSSLARFFPLEVKRKDCDIESIIVSPQVNIPNVLILLFESCRFSVEGFYVFYVPNTSSLC